MSTTMVQRSGTLLSAPPPWMRPRLTDGRSKNSEDSRENGRDSIRRNTSIAFRTALSPSHGVDPCAERPWMCSRNASTPLACTPTCRSLGVPRHDVDMAVEDQRRPLLRPDVGEQHRQLSEREVANVDLARLQPALDE